MKTMKLLLKIGGFVMLAAGVACLVAGYFDQIKALCPCKKQELPAEYEDFADVE